MTRVDFYILQDVDWNAACRFACRLAVKAVGSGNRVHMHTDDVDAAADLDDLLWNYPEHRFLPHVREDDPASGGNTVPAAPVVLGWSLPAAPDGVLINLASEIPTFFGRFERVAEIVVDENRATGRARYKFYRDRGYPLHHHQLDEWETA
ncbi:MAG: DNA polymerase III subunit chi [Pseudomonadota bacterium]